MIGSSRPYHADHRERVMAAGEWWETAVAAPCYQHPFNPLPRVGVWAIIWLLCVVWQLPSDSISGIVFLFEAFLPITTKTEQENLFSSPLLYDSMWSPFWPTVILDTIRLQISRSFYGFQKVVCMWYVSNWQWVLVVRVEETSDILIKPCSEPLLGEVD